MLKIKALQKIFKEEFAHLKQLISVNEKICIITHHNPDGDAIGSSLGLYSVLKNMGKQVQVIVPNDYPEFLQWLPTNETVLRYNKQKEKCETVLKEATVIFCLDFNEPKRLSGIYEAIEQTICTKVLIDHHPNPDNIFNISISDISVSSTAELVYETVLACELESYMDKNAATCLYTGLMTDTNSFTVNCSNPRTFEIASKFLAFNIDREFIHNCVFNNFSENRQRLLGYVLNEKMVVLPEFSTAYIWLTRSELQKYCFQPGDSEGFVNYPLSIKGIKFSAFFMERERHIKISFRSKGSIPANQIMKDNFMGGGHRNAAGGEEDKLNMEDTIKKFLSLLPKYSDILNS